MDPMTRPTDLCYEIADSIVGARYEKLGASAVEGAKKSTLDTLGVILAASGMEPAVRCVIDLVKESGGAAESSVLAFGGRVPAIMAAFANGAMAHCLDYDDQTPWGQHSASSLLPAVFAIAEKRGRVSGKEWITAVAVGQDLFNRLRRYVDWQKDWNFSTVIGVYCATAASGLLLRLSRDQLAHAFGIATMQSCGTAQVLHSVGSDLRAMYAGFPAKGAVMAALLAQRGMTGVPDVFEGKHGILDMYFGGRYDREKILEGLGAEYTGGLTLYKRWPAVGTAHSHMHATMCLVKEHNLQPSDIREIRAFVGDYHQIMCEPLEARRVPETLVDAKFSLPFLVAISAVHRDMRLADFTSAGLRNAEVLAMAQKVVPIKDETLDWKLELPAGRVEIVIHDGRTLQRTGNDVPGSATAPMNWDDIARKFEDCASVANLPGLASRVRTAQDMAHRLERIDDATELLRLLSP
jgi:2-methylcitrate dehydratase PrpD